MIPTPDPHQLVASGRPSAKPAADWTPTTARSWSSVERGGAGVGAGGAHARADLVDQVLDAGAGRVEVHPRRTRCPPRRAPCGPGRTPTRSTVRLAHRAGRGHPEGLLVGAAVGVLDAGRRATRGCRRTTSRSSPARRRRPGRARRRAGGALPRRPRRACPSSRAAAAHSSTAENCGRPTPVIIRVVHMAPGPDADLDDVGAGLDQVAGALGGDHVAGHDRHRRVAARGPRAAPRASGPGGRARCRRRGSRRRRRAASAALPATSPLTPTAAAIRSRPAASTAGRVERGAQRAGAGEHADQPAVVVDDRRERGAAPRRGRRTPPAGRVSAAIVTTSGVITSLDLGEPVDLGAVRLGDDADGPAVLDHDHGAGATRLGISASASPTVWSGPARSGCRRPGAAASPTRTTSATTGIGMSCGMHGEPAAAGDRLGHPLAGDRGHVRDDERDASRRCRRRWPGRRRTGWPTAERRGTMKTSS